MPHAQRTTRRKMLTQTLTAAAAAGVIHVTEESEAQSPASKPAWAIACRDAHLTEVGKPDVWSAMDAIGVEGVEVTVHMDGTCPGLFGREKPFSIADEGGVGDLGDALGSHKKKISAFCLHNRFDEQPDEEVAFVKRVTKVAVKLGVRAIRLDVVPRKLAGKDEEFLRFAIEVGKRIIDATRDTSVRFGVENHGGTTNRPDFLRRLFDGIGSNRFGLTLDTANFYWFGHPLSRLYEIYREFAPAACHTHCKSIRYPESEREKQRERGWEYGKFCCPVYEGDIDFTRVATILREAGYQGDLCIENESLSRFDKGERGAILRREADFLRRIAQNA